MVDIVDLAANSNNFKTLTNAVKATELAEILKKSGPFTVFAPSDDAFAKMPLVTVVNLWADLAQFKHFLTDHVVSGKLMQADLKNIRSVSSVEGKLIPINFTNGFSVNDITVVAADIEADNGVIHVIDEVISLRRE
ncbi:MAG: fasciclin domain-containing protein [Xenococcaceae cyanobacterium]